MEVLVVISIAAVLMGILLPVLGQVRRLARTVQNIGNQRQIAIALDCYASDNDESYPESVATLGTLKIHWNWHEPMRLTGIFKLSPQRHRAMSEYLGRYIKDASTMFCPNAPRRYKYFQEAWDAGDEWDNPETAPVKDPLSGTYCFYWNYIGFLGEGADVFRGPTGPSGGRWESKLLMTDYFGYDSWRSHDAFLSCERFKGATVWDDSDVSSAYWVSGGDCDSVMPHLKLYAGYVDGHVESFSSSDVVEMRASIVPDGSEPYPEGVGPGVFYLPRNGLH